MVGVLCSHGRQGAKQPLEYISLLSALHALIRKGVVGHAPGVRIANLDSASRPHAGRLRNGPAADDDARAWKSWHDKPGDVGQTTHGSLDERGQIECPLWRVLRT